ncbi:MAG: hypothetical protein ACRYFB_02225 [Janthinobacterium lividum]
MNKQKAHIILSWLLLLFFAVGQVTVYAHQHHSKYQLFLLKEKHCDKRQIVQEKCSYCDQMHHAPLGLVQLPYYKLVISRIVCVYYTSQHHYKRNSLIHADGLSPPVLV